MGAAFRASRKSSIFRGPQQRLYDANSTPSALEIFAQCLVQEILVVFRVIFDRFVYQLHRILASAIWVDDVHVFTLVEALKGRCGEALREYFLEVCQALGWYAALHEEAAKTQQSVEIRAD